MAIEVANASGTAIQRSHYYPFGTAFAENTTAEQGKQLYKYNGKELDMMHGLNWYDSNARFYDPVIPRTPTLDPHAENYYAWSPYAWVGNNPIIRTDPTGMDWYLNEQTGETYFNRDISDKTTTYKDQIYTRIGSNTMFGNQGKISERYYNAELSQVVANAFNYSINPTQELVSENTTETSVVLSMICQLNIP